MSMHDHDPNRSNPYAAPQPDQIYQQPSGSSKGSIVGLIVVVLFFLALIFFFSGGNEQAEMPNAPTDQLEVAPGAEQPANPAPDPMAPGADAPAVPAPTE